MAFRVVCFFLCNVAIRTDASPARNDKTTTSLATAREYYYDRIKAQFTEVDDDEERGLSGLAGASLLHLFWNTMNDALR